MAEYKQLNITAPSNVDTVSTAATAANNAPGKDYTVDNIKLDGNVVNFYT
jgi:hypothetical protein